MSINDYNNLGLKINASDEDVKKKYKQLALKYHPDKNNNDKDSEEKFKTITTSYKNIINKKSNINLNNIFNNISQFSNIVQFNNIGVLPTQTCYKSTSIYIQNGKKIETIREKINGVTRTRTIITDL